jgi:hypothetical protein
MSAYIQVAEEEGEEPIEIPCEDDSTNSMYLSFYIFIYYLFIYYLFIYLYFFFLNTGFWVSMSSQTLTSKCHIWLD